MCKNRLPFRVLVGSLSWFTIFASLNKVGCPDGEIGRRTVFRSQRPQGCAGSNPVLGTKNAVVKDGIFLFLKTLLQ